MKYVKTIGKFLIIILVKLNFWEFENRILSSIIGLSLGKREKLIERERKPRGATPIKFLYFFDIYVSLRTGYFNHTENPLSEFLAMLLTRV